MASKFSLVLVTCPAKDSRKVARAVVRSKAAACVNIVPGLHSIFRWKGKIEEADECLLLMKTRTSLVGKLEQVVKKSHPYDVPEVISIEIARGLRRYLDWIVESTAEN